MSIESPKYLQLDNSSHYHVEHGIDSKFHTFFLVSGKERNIRGVEINEYTFGNRYINLQNMRSLFNGNLISTNKNNIIVQTNSLLKLVFDSETLIKGMYTIESDDESSTLDDNFNNSYYDEKGEKVIKIIHKPKQPESVGMLPRDEQESHEEKERNPYAFSNMLSEPLVLELLNSVQIDGHVCNLVLNRHGGVIFLELFDPENKTAVLMSDVFKLNEKPNGYFENYMFKDLVDNSIHVIFGDKNCHIVTWKKNETMKLDTHNIFQWTPLPNSCREKLCGATYFGLSLYILKILSFNDKDMLIGHKLLVYDGLRQNASYTLYEKAFDSPVTMHKRTTFADSIVITDNMHLYVSHANGFIKKLHLVMDENNKLTVDNILNIEPIYGLTHDDESYIKDDEYHIERTINVPLIRKLDDKVISLYHTEDPLLDNLHDFSVIVFNKDNDIHRIESIVKLLPDIGHHDSLMWDLIVFKNKPHIVIVMVDGHETLRVITLQIENIEPLGTICKKMK